MQLIKVLGLLMMVFGSIGLIFILVRSWINEVNEVLEENRIDVCPSCQDEVVIGDTLCPACEAFIANLEYCEKHKMIYDGATCPKCRYGDLTPIR